MSCKFLGLDYGSKTIGVSVSSPSGKVATGVTTLTRTDENALRPSLKALKEIIRQYGITHIILGYPKHMSGDESERCQKTLIFKEKLNRYFKSIPVELWDERLSTAAVTRTFEGKQADYKKHVDEMAAVYILQGYLDRRSNMENENTIVLYDEDGNEIAMQILSSRQMGEATYVLVAEEDDEESAEVMHFKLIDDGDNDTIFEMVDEEHADFDSVFELFKDDYAELGIEIEDIGI